MIGRKPLPKDRFVVEPWRLRELGFAADTAGRTETLFALGNGYIGVRGIVPTGEAAHHATTLVSGFHERWTINYPEAAFGFATVGQTIARAPDATRVRIQVDGDILDLHTAEYQREFDIRKANLTSRSRWTTRSGVEVQVFTHRIVSLVHRNLIAMRWEIHVDRECDVELISTLINVQDLYSEPVPFSSDPRLSHQFDSRVLQPVAQEAENGRILIECVTQMSRIGLGCGVHHELTCEAVTETTTDRDRSESHWEIRAEPGNPIALVKYAVYHTNTEQEDGLLDDVAATLDSAASLGYETIVAEHEAAVAEFWDRADVVIDGHPEVQGAVRWCVLQLHQATALVANQGIGAKGLTSQAYEGHAFWDTEIYEIPFLSMTSPELAAGILRWRHSKLPLARERAGDLSERGALFPWRTIDGHEASAYFPAGTAQHHINSAIAYAIDTYVNLTGDRLLLWDIGVEVLVETARFWLDVGYYRDGEFHIYGVTGPDEYTAIVNDNAYTNVMAAHNLRLAADAVREMRREAPQAFAELAEAIDIEDGEVDEWERAAAAMRDGFDEERNLTAQDNTFLGKEMWDFAETPPDKYPLLLHYHPLVIYRKQVLKQPDVVLAMLLLPDLFDADLKRANFDYYEPLTTNDSSLSPGVRSILAAEVGHAELAMEHFLNAAFMDVEDVAGNSADGVHMAAAGSVWMAAVYGFGGFRRIGDQVHFNPRLPAEWSRLAFTLLIRGVRVHVELVPGTITFTADGDLPVHVQGREVPLTATAPVAVDLTANAEGRQLLNRVARFGRRRR